MADPPPSERVLAAFSPPLDSALVYAILSDFPEPLSQADERAARDILQSLADEAEPRDQTIPSRAAPGSPLVQHLPTDNATGQSREPQRELPDEDAQTLVHATAQLQLDRPLPASASRQQRQSGSYPPQPYRSINATTCEFEGAVNQSSQNDDSADLQPSSEDGTSRSGESSSAATSTETRFWDQAAASITSDEDGGVPGPGLIWDPPECSGFEFEVSDDPLAFLASVFPHIDLAQLETKIAEVAHLEPTRDGLAARPSDLEALIEDLLSQDLITSLAEADADAAAAANAPAPDPDGLAAMDRQQRRRFKAANKAAQSLSLTSMLHAPYAKAATPTRSAASALAEAPRSTNAWASISSQASFLAACMHIPTARITSTYHAHESNLARTVTMLLTQLARERPFESLPGGVARKNELRLIVPSTKASEDDLEALLSATEGDLSDALDLLGFVADLEKSSGTRLPLSGLVVRPGAGSALAFPAVPGGGPITTEGGSTVGSTPSRSSSQRGVPRSAAPAPVASCPTDDRYTHEQCQSLALEYLVKRNDAFRTAARSFQRGGTGERGAAGYWADRGREYDAERRKWEERAARAMVGERRTRSGTNTIDLHGLTLANALAIVDEACNTWWTNARDTIHPEPLRIVTGSGRHSRGGVPVLGPAVAKHLDRKGWRWKWDEGPLGVGVGSNKGAVRVIGVVR